MFAEIIDQPAGSSHTRKSVKGRLVLWLRLWQVFSKYMFSYFAKLLHLTAYHASDIMNATLKVRLSDRTWCGALLAFMLLWRCSEVSSTSWYGRTIWVSDWMWWCAGLNNRCLKCPIKTMFINNTMVPKEFMFLNHQVWPVQRWKKRGRDLWSGEATHRGNWGEFFNNKQRISNFVVDQYSFFLLPGNLFDRNWQVPAAPGEVHRPAAPNPLPGDHW